MPAKRDTALALPPILAVLDAAVVGEGLVDALRATAAGGARWIEYRDKLATEAVFHRRAEELAEACRLLDLVLLVNDRVAVAAAIEAVGVHLGADDLPAPAARRVLGPAAKIGISVDTAAEAAAAQRLPIDYVALGPIFATANKADAGPVVGLEGLRAVRRAVTMPLMAIGGIDVPNAARVARAGADCVAAIAAIFAQPDIERATRSLLDAALSGLAGRGALD